MKGQRKAIPRLIAPDAHHVTSACPTMGLQYGDEAFDLWHGAKQTV